MENQNTKEFEEMKAFMLEKSNSANVEPVFTTKDGREILLGEDLIKLLDDVLEQAFIPFLSKALLDAGYRRCENPDNIEIRVKMDSGNLIAGRNPDPDYDGIYVAFETIDGTIIDVALAETKSESGKKNIDVYCYEDVYTEDFTRKYTINTEEVYKALNI